jgi:hypothetical protein
LKALSKYNEEKERQHAGCEPNTVRCREWHDVGRLTKQREDRRGGEEQDRGGNGEQTGENHSALHAACDRGRVARPDRLGDDRIQDHQCAHAEHGRHEEIQIAERHRREGLGRQVPDHDRVDDAHTHQTDLNEDHGQREVEHGAQLVRPGQEPAGQTSQKLHSGWTNRAGRGLFPAGLGEQPLGEIETLGELGNLGTQGIQLFEHLLRDRAAGGSFFHVPPSDEASVAITKRAARHQDQIVEPPNPEAPEREKHEGARLGPAEVEAMGAEDAEERGESRRDAARFLGGLLRRNARGRIGVGHGGNIRGAEAGVHRRRMPPLAGTRW